MVRIKSLVWDNWNVEHIGKHKVSLSEVEIALKDKQKKALKTYKGRLLVLGRAKKRLLSIVLALEEKQNYYVVTARDMSKKERRFYGHDQKKKNS